MIHQANWFTNGTLAAKATMHTQDHSDTYKTYGKTSWGITASDGPVNTMHMVKPQK